MSNMIPCIILTCDAEIFRRTTPERDGKDSLQIYGTAAGTKTAPSFANLLLGLFESKTLAIALFKPHWYTWLR